MILLIIALFGFILPNGILIYWLFNEFRGLSEVLQNKLALAFIIDVFLAMLVLAYFFARHPIGKVKWYWFVALSLVGGLSFSIPFYWWLNEKKA